MPFQNLFNLLEQSLLNFWLRYPACFYGIVAACSAACSLFSSAIPLICLLFLIFPFFKVRLQKNLFIRRGLIAFVLWLAVFTITTYRYEFPDGTLNKQGFAEINIISSSISKSHVGSKWKYKAKLVSFKSQDSSETVARNIPVIFSINDAKVKEMPTSGNSYIVKAILKKIDNRRYTLKSMDESSWKKLAPLWSASNWRQNSKESVQNYIQNQIDDHHVASFLSGIATGQFDDAKLSGELGRFGLQHLMAISGLHFSILASILAIGLSLMMPKNYAAFVIIIFLSSYFFFLGSSPSVLRAWIAITIALIGVLMERSSLAINSLGIALLAVAILDPLLIESIAFQFSFGITASILLWSSPCNKLLEKIFPKRPLSKIAHGGYFIQHGLCLLSFFKSSLSLMLAVNLTALPLTLYHFNKFQGLGLVYNLFFPFLVTLSIILLLAGCLTSFIPLLSAIFHQINNYYTGFLLNLTFNLPKSLEINWFIESASGFIVGVYLFILLLTGIVIQEKYKEERETPSWMI